MNFNALLSSSIFLKIIFTVALFALILIAGISYRHTNAVTESGEKVMHTHEVQKELEELLSHLKDAETGQRGYIINKDSVFLEPYNNAKKVYLKSFIVIKKLVQDNKQQQINLDTLSQLINSRFSILDSNLNETNAAALKVSMLRGKTVMDKIRFQIKLMNDLEAQYLTDRKIKFDKDSYLTPIFTLALVFFSLLVFLFSFAKINRDISLLKKTNEALKINAESISQAEEIGDFSNWQWNLETEKYIFSDNLYRFLGCEPQSFEANLENFLNFIHPDDRHLLIEGTEKVLNEGKTSKHIFRIIRKDGDVVYAKSISKLLTDVIGKKIVIGITTNITKDYLHSQSLSEMNRELAESNAELSSFNYVASHDLQEPLRKIQTFISRISDNDLQNMSESGKGYFTKIENSVARMRQLIKDLLSFSRANKAESIFEETDLNVLLENSKQELAQIIDEKKAIINTVTLPTLQVIPFQIQQVFTNLIGNSLKYSQPNINPIINIACILIDKKTPDEVKLLANKKYYRFTFTDNGLGFEQEYAEQIFVLFKRLHDSSTYLGTGIGLSICKKIIYNHSGFIYAQSKLAEGATFTFYLPG
jgi:CHASE3 domain sensor protein/nitrogen-specific signal transduction histidine kinase